MTLLNEGGTKYSPTPAELVGNPQDYVVDVSNYRGRSERIKGFARVHEALRGIKGVETIAPLIILPQGYDNYKNGQTENLALACEYIFNALNGEDYPLIVRRLFPDLNGEAQSGPRSPNISKQDDLYAAVLDFYRYFEGHYDTSEVSPEIMVHRVIDVGRPPKIKQPFLPHTGGDVIKLDDDEYQIRGIYGADESVQGYPSDIWTVRFRGDAEVVINLEQLAKKTSALVPSEGAYVEIAIPEDAQGKPSLDFGQILSLAEAGRKMSNLYTPHRLEFDGTQSHGNEVLMIIEAAPFTIVKDNGIAPEGERVTGLVKVFKNELEFDQIHENELLFVHLSSNYFKGNDKREALTRLAAVAKGRNSKLLVFASGNIATQHAVRVLLDTGNSVVFIGDETFYDGEKVHVTTRDGKIHWDRDISVASREQLDGKDVDKIGGKAKGLLKLASNGFATPKFGVVETSLFNEIIEDLQLQDLIKQLDQPDIDPIYVDDLSKGIQDLIANYRGGAITKNRAALDALLKDIGSDRFAIRSSASCEDGKISFAGVFETKLGIEEADVEEAMLSVLLSVFSPVAIRSIRAFGLKPSEVSMAVIIQEMIEGGVSGTMFTKDPTSNDGSLRIDAALGTGDLIVEGVAQKYHSIIFDRSSNQIKSDVVFGEESEIIPEHLKEQIINLGLSVERVFREGPQDIEWVIDSHGNLLALQSRQI